MKIHILPILFPAALCLLGTFAVPRLQAQKVIGGTTPDPSALLDVQSAAGGVLLPRMSTAERTAIVYPATGLIIYNTTLNCMEMNVGTPERPAWGCLLAGASNPTANANCGAYIAPGEWKAFMCHNLGADQSADPFTPSWRLNGHYYQWGRAAVAAAGPTGPSSGEANDGAIAGWNTTPAPNDAWSDATKTTNDPCPSGFRVPTKAQWDAIVNTSINPTRSFVGTSWTWSSTNYSSGLRIGSGSSGLFLPTTGFRDATDGSVYSRGGYGSYWSSGEAVGEDGPGLFSLTIGDNTSLTGYSDPVYGMSVRCIAE
ncbi:MAG: FISUMP domain-containing protein [Saprospiraceae bacterium]